jgi:hypothetical protein
MGFYKSSAWKTYIDNAGNLILGDIAGGNTGLSWNQVGGTLTVKGAITADTGYIGGTTGWTIATGYIKKDTGVELTSAGMAPADYPFYAGAQYANRATAPFNVSSAGILSATGGNFSGTITGGTITGATVQTASSGKRLSLSGSVFQGYNSAGQGSLTIGGDSAQIYAFADGALPAAIFFTNDNSTSADVVKIDGSNTSGIGLKITGGGNTNNNLVAIEAGSGAKNLLYIANAANTPYSLARFYQNYVTKTGIFISQDSSDVPSDIGIIEVKDYIGGLNCLHLDNAHGHAHIIFTGGGTCSGLPTSVLDSYSESNKNRDIYLSSAEKLAVSQSFTAGATKNIGKVTLYLRKAGSPTGNITVQIYAHSGTYGTNSVPTGAALATSDNVSITGLTTSYALYDFNFSGANQISLTSTTQYVLVIRYTGGDGGNDLYVGIDDSPTHGGNWATSTDGTTFSADNTRDICFYVYGLVIPDGAMWYDETHLYFQKGASTITLT